MSKLPIPAEGIVLTHFIVSDDVERSRQFYTEVLGGETIRSGEPSFVALANSWIIINVGGGPTDDKPTVTLETPSDPDRVSSFLNIRVADIEAVYSDWSSRGADFLTAPKQHAAEIRCYIRDPDGHLIEVGQTIRPTPGRSGVTTHRAHRCVDGDTDRSTLVNRRSPAGPNRSPEAMKLGRLRYPREHGCGSRRASRRGTCISPAARPAAP